MGFIKVVKNKAYFKRFQVQKRRRREGKTDFMARNAMVKQDKNKYNAPRYRLVVRHTNTKVVCQIVYATIAGDKVLAQALSTELPRYGIKAGLNNFAATYATGLLVARRLLKQLDLEEAFEGVEEADGEEFHVEEEVDEDERRPFKAILDIGLVRTTVGAKCFAAMKGAADGGLHIPHNCKRFPGYVPAEEKGMEAEFNAEALADRIFGRHVSEYMESMEEEDQQKYEAHFASYIKAGISADDVEDMYKDAHAKIREDPSFTKKEKKDIKLERRGNKVFDGKKTYVRSIKKTKSERFATVATKIQNHAKRVLASMEDDEEE
jgi:large subunit ribosomal protein L5e